MVNAIRVPILNAIARIVHDECLHHPGVRFDVCQNELCRAQAVRIAEMILAEVKKI